jgi:AmmeMemoRadiSam system protein B
MESQLDVRPSPIAGQWYPASPRVLADSVDAYIRAAGSPQFAGQVVGIIVPHAGHRYSGPVAGYAYAALRGLAPELVAVVSPMHYPYYQPLLTSAHAAYATPLGSVPIDQEALAVLEAGLQDALGYGLSAVRKDPEHALEIELPFLQRALPPGFQLLPLMLRDQSPHMVQAVGRALAQALRGRQSLLVASTDLSHFYTQAEAEALDAEMLRRVADFNPDGVLSAEDEGVGFACGRAAVAAVLWAAQELGADRVQVLHHATSGDVSGDFTQVVGYAAALILKT